MHKGGVRLISNVRSIQNCRTMKTVFAFLIVSLFFLASDSFAQTPKASVFAGSGFYGWVDGKGEKTMFKQPASLAFDTKGDLYVWDDGTLRRITPDATVSTVRISFPMTWIEQDTFSSSVVTIFPSSVVTRQAGGLWISQGSSIFYFYK